MGSKGQESSVQGQRSADAHLGLVLLPEAPGAGLADARKSFRPSLCVSPRGRAHPPGVGGSPHAVLTCRMAPYSRSSTSRGSSPALGRWSGSAQRKSRLLRPPLRTTPGQPAARSPLPASLARGRGAPSGPEPAPAPGPGPIPHRKG